MRPKKIKPAQKTVKYLFRKRIPTAEDWHPTHEDGCLEAKAMILTDESFRICFWGEDDFGMEQNFKEHTHELRMRWVRWLNQLALVSQKDLRERGFYNA